MNFDYTTGESQGVETWAAWRRSLRSLFFSFMVCDCYKSLLCMFFQGCNCNRTDRILSIYIYSTWFPHSLCFYDSFFVSLFIVSDLWLYSARLYIPAFLGVHISSNRPVAWSPGAGPRMSLTRTQVKGVPLEQTRILSHLWHADWCKYTWTAAKFGTGKVMKVFRRSWKGLWLYIRRRLWVPWNGKVLNNPHQHLELWPPTQIHEVSHI